jgi:hypothetical protein
MKYSCYILDISVEIYHEIYLNLYRQIRFVLVRTSPCKGDSIARHVDIGGTQVLSSDANTKPLLQVQ